MKRKVVSCLRCNTPMDEGWLRDQDLTGAPSVEWLEDPADRLASAPGGEKRRHYAVRAYRCPKCSHVELFARSCGSGSTSAETKRGRSQERRRVAAAPAARRAKRSRGPRRRGMLVRLRRAVWKSVVTCARLVYGPGLVLLDRNCRWCKSIRLARTEPRVFEYPLYLLGIRPYSCPHCFMRFLRFK